MLQLECNMYTDKTACYLEDQFNILLLINMDQLAQNSTLFIILQPKFSNWIKNSQPTQYEMYRAFWRTIKLVNSFYVLSFSMNNWCKGYNSTFLLPYSPIAHWYSPLVPHHIGPTVQYHTVNGILYVSIHCKTSGL